MAFVLVKLALTEGVFPFIYLSGYSYISFSQKFVSFSCQPAFLKPLHENQLCPVFIFSLGSGPVFTVSLVLLSSLCTLLTKVIIEENLWKDI